MQIVEVWGGGVGKSVDQWVRPSVHLSNNLIRWTWAYLLYFGGTVIWFNTFDMYISLTKILHLSFLLFELIGEGVYVEYRGFIYNVREGRKARTACIWGFKNNSDGILHEYEKYMYTQMISRAHRLADLASDFFKPTCHRAPVRLLAVVWLLLGDGSFFLFIICQKLCF